MGWVDRDTAHTVGGFRTVLNVSGDLAACTVMDRWVGAKKPLEKELAEQRAIERKQELESEDVVVT